MSEDITVGPKVKRISFLGRHRTKPTQTLQFIINQEKRGQQSIRIAFMRGTSLNMLRCASALLLLFGLSHCAELLITNYGAVSDDNIDDYGAFVEAINAAQSGDTIRVPTGVYLISSTITLNKSGVKFLGNEGAGVSTIFAQFGDDMLSVEGSNVEVAYLTFEGDSVATNGIVVSASSGVTIHHNTVQNLISTEFGPMGIYFASDVVDSYIHHNTIVNIGVASEWGSGIRMSWGSHRNVIEFNSIDLTGRGGIFCSDNSNHNIIRNNTIAHSGKHSEGLGIEAWGNCNQTLIENNVLDHWISLDNSHFCAVRNNVVEDLEGYMAIGLEAVAVSRSIFTDNTVQVGQHIGLSISNTMRKEYVLFGYNTFTNNAVWAAQLQGEAGGIHSYYFYKNAFTNTQTNNPSSPYPDADGHGLRINGNTFNTVFEDNDISNNMGLGVQSLGPVNGLEFINNKVTSNVDDAFDGEQGAQFVWEGNTVVGNGFNNQFTSNMTNKRPVADFTYTVSDLTASFSSQVSDSDGSVVEMLWDFNSGVPTTEPNPSYTFPTEGIYRVTLLVWDDTGRGTRVEKMVDIGSDTQVPQSPTPEGEDTPMGGETLSSASISSTSLILASVALIAI